MKCNHCGFIGCACLFTEESKAAKVPVCKKCAGKAQLEELAEINHKEKTMPKKMLIQIGHNNAQYHDLCKRYADQIGYDYGWVDKKTTLYQSAEKLKIASMVAIWNGKQMCAGLAEELCIRRKIPYFFFENGMLPQMGHFFIDPFGFAGKSILNGDLSWVTDADMENLYKKRAELQAQYPRNDEGFILVPLQLHNDATVLYHSVYNDMNELIADVEKAYPDDKIIVRPHPQGGVAKHECKGCEEIGGGDFLSWAARAKRVVGITSTCLQEANVLGIPVTAFGDHALNTHPPEMHDKVAAGALVLNVPRNDGDIKPILDRFGYGVTQ